MGYSKNHDGNVACIAQLLLDSQSAGGCTGYGDPAERAQVLEWFEGWRRDGDREEE